MLRDAARLQLRLTRAAMGEGMTTKDATSYNVQFQGTRPVFIDVGSFEAARREPWPGYGQFCNLFLNPLLVQAVADVAFQPLLRGALDGIPPATTAAILGGRGRFTKGVFTNVKLLARAEGRYANADTGTRHQAGTAPGRVRPRHRGRPAQEPAQGRRRAELEPGRVDVVGLLRPVALHRPRSRHQDRHRA